MISTQKRKEKRKGRKGMEEEMREKEPWEEQKQRSILSCTKVGLQVQQ